MSNMTFYFNLIRSGDATARIWQIPANPEDALQDPIVLKHLPALTDNNKDVTAMDWNVWKMTWIFLLLSALQRFFSDFFTLPHFIGCRDIAGDRIL